MQKNILETSYFIETNHLKRKKILDSLITSCNITPEIELCQKLYNARYGNSGKNQEVDCFIRGLMTLEYMKNYKGFLLRKKRIQQERHSILKDLQCDLVKFYGDIGELILYNEYCNLIRRYLELCERDRTYSSFIFGLGKIKRTTFEKKVCDDIYRIAYVVPQMLNLEDELCLFSKAASDIVRQQYPCVNKSATD